MRTGRRTTAAHAVAAVAALGLVVLMVGTFLPWLRSGQATRNSYEASGLVRRLIHPPGVLDEFYRAWPLLGVVCAVAVAAYLIELRSAGLVIGMLASLAGGGAAVAALRAPHNTYASVIDTGPAITLAGAVVVLVSVGARLATRERPAPYGRSRNDSAAE